MRTGQIFSGDLLFSFILIVAAIGLLTQAWDLQLQQSSSTVEQAKMQQIAMDAAALHHYKIVDEGLDSTHIDYSGLDTSALNIGYEIRNSDSADKTCVANFRGTANNETKVFVCRGA